MGVRSDSPSLTDRRKAATRLEIARAAVRLFTAKGVSATTAEEIAAAAGVSRRTFWRYTPSKEACVVPLLTAGVDRFTEALRAWPRDQGLDALLKLLEQGRETLRDAAPFLALVRAARRDPALRAVWLRAHDEAETGYAIALAERMGRPAESLPVRILATLLNNTLRVATEDYASHGARDGAVESIDGLAAAVGSALRDAAGGFA